MNNDNYNKAIQRMAEQLISGTLPDDVTLRKLDSTGIVLESDAVCCDSVLTSTLLNLSERFGYTYGECKVEIETVKVGFFNPYKTAKVIFE